MIEEPVLKKKKENKKQYIYYGIISLFLVVSISYGFVYFLQQKESSTLSFNTALFDVTMTENGSINIPSATGQRDEDGVNNTKTSLFVRNNTETTISVTVSVIETMDSTLDNTDVRFGVFENNVTKNIGNVGENNNILYTYELAPNAEKTIQVALWLDYYYTGQNEAFVARFNIEAKQVDEYGRIYLTKLVDKNKGIIKVSNTEYRYNSANSENYISFNNDLYRIIGVINNQIKIVNNTAYAEDNIANYYANITDKSLLDETAGAVAATQDTYNSAWLDSVTKKAVLTLKENVYIVGGIGTETSPYVISNGL